MLQGCNLLPSCHGSKLDVPPQVHHEWIKHPPAAQTAVSQTAGVPGCRCD